MPARIRRSGSERRGGEDRVEGARPALPGDEHAGLVGDRGDGEDHVGDPGHVGLAQLERDHERRAVERRAERRRVGRVVGVDAADDEAVQLAGDQRRDDLVGVAAGGLGQRVDTPRRWPASTRAAASATGRPPGSRFGRQPVSTAPRSPARRGTQASLAPVLAATSAAALSAPGEVASRSPTRITAVLSMPWSAWPSRSWSASASRAGLGRDQLAAELLEAARGERRDRDDARARRTPGGLAQPQEDRARLVLGLEAGEDDGGGGLEVGVRRALAEHDLGGEERGLLRRERTGAEVDVVGAEGDAGELAVGVAVLGGDPAAGQHGGRAGVGEPAGGDGEGLGPATRDGASRPRRAPAGR